MSNAIETSGLRYRAGKSFAIQDVNLHVPEGAVYGFLGPNGAGKTTTMRLLLGLLRQDAGDIRLLGHPMPQGYVEALQKVGYVPERPHLYPTFSIHESLAYHAAFFPTWDEAHARELASRFELPGDRRLSSLSKGETGKLMMLLALAQRPRLLALDEPTDGLDPVVRRDVLEALLDYVSSSGATVFISSHLVHELERICDWIGVMDRGRLIAELPMEEFRAGIKRLRVVTGAQAGEAWKSAPFSVLARHEGDARGEQWLVRGWKPEMAAAVEAKGVSVREVVDLDLEEGFVELLRSFRAPAGESSNGAR